MRNVSEWIIGRGARGSRRLSRRARGARSMRDKNFRRESAAGEGNAWRTWSMVLSPLAFRGLSGVNIPGGSWLLSISRSAGRAAARCAFTRAREAAFRTEAGGAKCDPASMEKKARNLLSVTGGPLAWRARLCEARAGGVSNERLGCWRRRFLVLLQCRAKPAARRVKCGARSRNSPRLPLALTPDVTTRKVRHETRRARAFLGRAARGDAQVSLPPPPSVPKNRG